MNIIEALKKLRDDLRTWARNNFKNVLTKQKATEDKVVNLENKTSNITEDESAALQFADPEGNVVAQIDESGISTVGVKVNGKAVALQEDLEAIDLLDTEVKLQSELKTYYNVGKVTTASGTNPVTIGNAGDSLRNVFDNLFTMDAEVPTVTLPSLSLTLSNDSANIEYGKTVKFYANITASTGKFHSSYYSGGSTASTGVTWGTLNLESTNSTFDSKTSGITAGTKFEFTPSSTYYAVADGGTIKGKAIAPSGYTSNGTTAKNNLGQDTDIKIESDTSAKESSEASTKVSAGYIPYTYVLATGLPAELPTANRSQFRPSSITVSGGSANTYLYIFVPSAKADISTIKSGGFGVPFTKVETGKSYIVNNNKSTTYKVFKTDSTVVANTFNIE